MKRTNGHSRGSRSFYELLLGGVVGPNLDGKRKGGYYGPTAFFDMCRSVGDAIIEKRAQDETVAKRLWQVSEESVGEAFEV